MSALWNSHISRVLIRASPAKPHPNRYYEINHILMYVRLYVAICCPRVLCACSVCLVHFSSSE